LYKALCLSWWKALPGYYWIEGGTTYPVWVLTPLPMEADLPEDCITGWEIYPDGYCPYFEEGLYFLLISSKISISFYEGAGKFYPFSPVKLLLMIKVGLYTFKWCLGEIYYYWI
jgi:hypothetical protein